MIRIELQNGKLSNNSVMVLNSAVENSLPDVGTEAVKMQWETMCGRGGCRVTGTSAHPALTAQVELTQLSDSQDAYSLDGITYNWTDEHKNKLSEHWTLTPMSEQFINLQSKQEKNKQRVQKWDSNRAALEIGVAIFGEAFREVCERGYDEDSFLDDMVDGGEPLSRRQFCGIMAKYAKSFENSIIKRFRDSCTTQMDSHGDPLFKCVMLSEYGDKPTLVAVLQNGEAVAFEDLTFGQMAYLADEII